MVKVNSFSRLTYGRKITPCQLPDASLVILTPIDPLFVLIPLFEQKQADVIISTKALKLSILNYRENVQQQGKAMFMSLEDLFHHDSVPDLPRLLTSLEHLPKSLERICAVTGGNNSFLCNYVLLQYLTRPVIYRSRSWRVLLQIGRVQGLRLAVRKGMP